MTARRRLDVQARPWLERGTLASGISGAKNAKPLFVTLRRAEPLDIAFHAALERTLDEWASPEDDEPLVICEPWQVVIVPFPFTDRSQTKGRPALVLSQTRFTPRSLDSLHDHLGGTRPWPGDTPLKDLVSTGLQRPCLVRLRIFTLDNRFILRRIGILAAADRKRLGSELAAHLVVTG